MTPSLPIYRRLSWPQLWRWGLLALAIVLLTVMAGRWAERRELQQKSDALHQAAEVYTLALRGIAEKHDQLPYTAARHPEVLALLLHPTDRLLVDRVNRYFSDLQSRTDSDALYVMGITGMTLAASNWSTADSFVGQSYRQRPYVEDALQGRHSFFYGVGLTTGMPGLFIAEPVRNGEEVIGVVAVKVNLSALQRAWANSVDPVVLQDSRGIVFLSSVPDWIYHSRSQLSADDLAWLSHHGQYGERSDYGILPWRIEKTDKPAEYQLHATLHRRQKSFFALDTRVPELGWTLTVTSNLAEVEQTRQEVLVLTALVAAVLLLGGLYWQQRERRFVEQRQARLELEQRVRERTHDLEEAHAFRKAMEDSLLVGMRARDPEGRIIYVNPALCEMLGYRAEELLGCKPPYPYWHPDNIDKHWNENDAALQGKAAPHGYESRFRHRDGRDVITMIYTAPLIDAQGRHQGWMSSIVDITAQKQAEARQLEQERQLERSARLASLGEMASTLAHELNQPLMALSNFALAARTMADQVQQPLLVSALDDIVAQSQRASDIVKRIRGFIRPQRGGYGICNVSTVLANALTMLQSELQRDQTSTNVQPTEDLPQVRGDSVLLQQVLINLLQNAMQAMQDLPTAQRIIDIDISAHESTLRIQVGDHGPGIPEALREKVFAPFFSTKADGLGLGLNICRTIIEAHGGHLKVINRDNGGALFSFSLPLVL